MFFTILLYFLVSYFIAAKLGNTRKIGFWGCFFVCLLLSPLGGVIVTLLTPSVDSYKINLSTNNLKSNRSVSNFGKEDEIIKRSGQEVVSKNTQSLLNKSSSNVRAGNKENVLKNRIYKDVKSMMKDGIRQSGLKPGGNDFGSAMLEGQIESACRSAAMKTKKDFDSILFINDDEYRSIVNRAIDDAFIEKGFGVRESR